MEGTTAPETESSTTMSLATIESAHGLTREQIQLIKDTIARGCTDEELQHFILVCNRLRLDPFSKQIYLIKRWDKKANRHVASVQVSIDGFRAVAARSREYRGQTMRSWCGWDGVWHDVWLGEDAPVAARVGVWREGFKEPLVCTALYKSYAQDTNLWRTMGEVMLLKCAEALALRAAFPDELGGVYTTDEMDQAGGNPLPAPKQPESFPLASLPAAEAQQRPQEAEYEPPASERRPAQVLPFRAAQEAPDGLSAEVLGNWGPKLRQCQSRDQLVSWMRQVIGCGFEPQTKRQLFDLWSRQVRACLRGEDPNVLLAEAKRS